MSKPKIAYLCLEPLRQGQAVYTHVTEIINGLRRLGYEVALFTPDYATREVLPGFLGRLWGIFKTQARLILTLKKFDTLYIRWHPLSFFTALLAQFMKINSIQEVNGPYEDLFVAWRKILFLKPILIYMFRKQLDWARDIIVVTPGLKEFVLSESINKRVTVIENGANVDHFTPGRKTDIVLPEKFVIFYGTFSKWYDLPLIIAAVGEPNWPQDLKLVFAGDGAQRHLVEQAASLNHNILYLGRVGYDQIPGVVCRAQACLIPSVNIDGRADKGLSPLKMYETLACGVPVIVSDLPGQADFVHQHKCGLVVDGQNVSNWLNSVLYLLSRDSDRKIWSQNARSAVVPALSWEMRAKEIAEILF